MDQDDNILGYTHYAILRPLQHMYHMGFIKIYQLKGLPPKNKGHMNFDELCD